MRGADEQSGSMFSYVSLEERVPKDHPLRAIRRITDRALEQLSKKARGREAHLGYLGPVLMEHRSGLIVRATVTPADGYGERDAALVMIEGLPGQHRLTVAADKGYDTRETRRATPPFRVSAP